jgi:hypothetical protein
MLIFSTINIYFFRFPFLLYVIMRRRRCSGRWCGGQQRGAHQLRHVPRQAARYSLCSLLKLTTRFLARFRNFDLGQKKSDSACACKIPYYYVVQKHSTVPWDLILAAISESWTASVGFWILTPPVQPALVWILVSIFAIKKKPPLSRFLWTLSCPWQWLFSIHKVDLAMPLTVAVSTAEIYR